MCLSLVHLSEILDRMKSKNSWCVSCRQVPLFQVANYNFCENIFGLTLHNCVEYFLYDENNNEFIYCTNCYGTCTMTKFSFSCEIDIATFLKTDISFFLIFINSLMRWKKNIRTLYYVWKFIVLMHIFCDVPMQY